MRPAVVCKKRLKLRFIEKLLFEALFEWTNMKNMNNCQVRRSEVISVM